MQQRLNQEEQHLMGPHMGILWDLMQHDGVRQQDLAISSLKDKATITRSVRVLEQEALVLRAPDPIDKRTKRIYLTTKGRRFFQRMVPTTHQIMEEAKSAIPTQDLETCAEVLQKMYNNLNK